MVEFNGLRGFKGLNESDENENNNFDNKWKKMLSAME